MPRARRVGPDWVRPLPQDLARPIPYDSARRRAARAKVPLEVQRAAGLKGAAARVANCTAAELSAIGRKGGLASQAARTREENRMLARRGADIVNAARLGPRCA